MSTSPRVLILTASESVALRVRLMAEAEDAQAVVVPDPDAARREVAGAEPRVVVLDQSVGGRDVLSGIVRGIPVLLIDGSSTGWETLRERLGRVLAGHPAEESDLLAEALAEARLLVVDDSRTYREYLRHELERLGAEVTVCLDAEEALNRVTAREFDGVLVDLVLPGIDGYRLCGEMARLRRDRRRHFVLGVLSSREGRSDKLRSLEAGADIFLRKSEDIQVLAAELGALLRRKFLMHADG